jgi:hypothetical protein
MYSVHTNPQSLFQAIDMSFENVAIDISGAGDFVPKVDIKIRRIAYKIKEIKNRFAQCQGEKCNDC